MNRKKKRPRHQPPAPRSSSPPQTISIVAGFFSRHRLWLFGLFLFAATMIAYQPVWSAGFIWDDDTYVTNNPLLASVEGLKKIWFDPGATVQYYPLAFTTFWLEYHLWGLHAAGYHLVNVSLHAFNAILFWLVLRRLGVRGAWLAAAIFALHPVCVESVAWVTERKNTLSGVFYLSSILAALEFWLPRETGSDSGGSKSGGAPVRFGSWKFYWLTLALYACALCSKTTTIPLPAVILLLVWWKRGRPEWRAIFPLLPFAALGIGMGLITMHVETLLGASGRAWDFSWLERCLLAARAAWFYLGKLFWPHPLIFVYPRWNINASQPAAWLPLLATACVLCILWWKRNGWTRPVLFASAYFAALLFLALGFFNVYYFRYSFVSDHFQYLASLGPIALAAAGMATAFGFWREKPFLKTTFCSVLLLALGALTWQQCKMYADAETLWRMTIGKNPNSFLAYNNLGIILYNRGQGVEAAADYKKALEINPGFEAAYNNLGLSLFQAGRMDEAVADYKRALEINPDYVEARNNLGLSLLQAGRLDEAIVQFQRALETNPDSAVIHYNLGDALFKSGRMKEAIVHYQKALEGKPGSAEIHYNLGTALMQLGRVDEAIVHYKKALETNPGLDVAEFNLARALAQSGRMDEAIVHYKRTLEINPGLAEAQSDLATALAQEGRTDEAILHFQKVVEIMPASAVANYNLGNILLQAGRADEAVVSYQKTLEIDPGFADAHSNLGTALLESGRAAEAVVQYQKALELQPQNTASQKNLAWLLATSPQASVRDGAKAVALARQADQISGGEDSTTLEILAAAYAEAGRFPEAISTAQRAMELANARTNAALAGNLQEQIKLYQAGSPFRDTGRTQ